MKRSLPTSRGRKSSQPAPRTFPPVAERALLTQPVVAIAQGTVGNASAELAIELVRALVGEGVPVSALVTSDDPHADAQAVLSRLHEAGARDTAWVRLSHHDEQAELQRTLARFGADEWLVVLGNSLPLYFRPELCVFVSAPHATHIPDAQRIAMHAQLQVSAPSAKLARELAALIRAKALVHPPTTG